ncbi:MAG: phosphate ABC transporter permease PstA [Spongiibacteraceae bacterium]
MSNPPIVSEVLSIPEFERQPFERRALSSTILTCVTWLIAVVGSVPLFSVIYMLIKEGGARLDMEALTALPPAGFETGGGFGNAIVGTAVMVLIATVISVPIGILSAIHLAVLDPASRLTRTTQFVAKTLTGFPSILAGVFTYAILVISFGYSAFAGGIALSVLMLPTVVLAAEEAMKQVPQKMIDAAYGMGCTPTQVILKVVLPTALPGIITGVMLAVAGAAGNSAPLLFTALFSNYYLSELMEPTASLSILIYNFSAMPFDNQIQLAWSASLVLVLIVLVFNILARLISRSNV